MNNSDIFDHSQVEYLRQMARQGKSVSDIIHAIRSTLNQSDHHYLLVIDWMMHTFNLKLREARIIKGAPCMGSDAISDEELDSYILPLILERLPPLEEKDDS